MSDHTRDLPRQVPTEHPYAPPSSSARRSAGRWPSIALAILVGISLLWFGAVVATSLGVRAPSLSLGGAQAPASGGPNYLYLTVGFNPTNGIDQYFPANFTVPVNSQVIVTITNYDDGVNVVPEMYTHVAGVPSGTFSYNDGLGDPATTMSSVPLSGISHTFTVMSMTPMGMGMGGTASGSMLNVPIPAASSVDAPVTVTFTVTFSHTGDLSWMCLAPCDPGSMGVPGFMAGTIHVV